MAEEARRWTLEQHFTGHIEVLDGAPPSTVVIGRKEADLPIHEPIGVREDRAYEADIEKAAQAIAFDDDRRGYEHANEAWEDLWEDRQQQVEHNQDPGEPTREDYRQNARAALNAVFSDRGVEKQEVPDA